MIISFIIIVLVALFLLIAYGTSDDKKEPKVEKVRRLTGLDLPDFEVIRDWAFGEFSQTVAWKLIRFSESLSDGLFVQLDEKVQKETEGWSREGDWYVFDWKEKGDVVEDGDFLSIKIAKGKRIGELYEKGN